MLSQGKVHVTLWPFVLVWGLLLLPTLLLWIAFVTAVLAWTDSRYLTYGIALAALVATLGAFLDVRPDSASSRSTTKDESRRPGRRGHPA